MLIFLAREALSVNYSGIATEISAIITINSTKSINSTFKNTPNKIILPLLINLSNANLINLGLIYICYLNKNMSRVVRVDVPKYHQGKEEGKLFSI